jgi:hypothetical protein
MPAICGLPGILQTCECIWRCDFVRIVVLILISSITLLGVPQDAAHEFSTRGAKTLVLRARESISTVAFDC